MYALMHHKLVTAHKYLTSYHKIKQLYIYIAYKGTTKHHNSSTDTKYVKIWSTNAIHTGWKWGFTVTLTQVTLPLTLTHYVLH